MSRSTEPASPTCLNICCLKGTRQLGAVNYEAEKPLLEKLDALHVQYDTLNTADEISEEQAAQRDSLKAEIERVQAQAQKLTIPNQVAELYAFEGSVGLNAGTGTDFTNYVVSLPANKIELWMRVEAERMRDPVLRDFYTERDVVMEERKQRIETDPFGLLSDALLTTAFKAHPYGTPIIGWESDIIRLKRPEAERFFKTYYAPNNAVITIVGDIDIERVIQQMERYFGVIPSQEIPPRIGTKEPKQNGERRVYVKFAAEPRLQVAFHKPTVPSYDDFVFDVIDNLLTSGRASRLYKTLVEERQVAVSVRSVNGYPGSRYPNLFLLDIVPRSPHTPEQVEQALYAEIERLKNEPASKRELQKVRNQFQANFIRGLNSNSGMASQLGYYELIAGSWRYTQTLLDTVNRIGSEDVQRVAQEYLTWENRTVAILTPKAPAPPAYESTEEAEEGEETGAAPTMSPEAAAAYERLEYISNNLHEWGKFSPEAAAIMDQLTPTWDISSEAVFEDAIALLEKLIEYNDPRAAEVFVRYNYDSGMSGAPIENALIALGPPSVPHLLPYLDGSAVSFVRAAESLSYIGSMYRDELGGAVEHLIIPKLKQHENRYRYSDVKAALARLEQSDSTEKEAGE